MNGIYPALAVITRSTDNDMLQAIRLIEPNVAVLHPDEVREGVLDAYEAIALLGGTEETPLLFPAHQRVLLERQIAAGKRIFAEYVASIGHVYCEPPQSTRYHRLIYCSKETDLAGLPLGALLDDQCGLRLRPFAGACLHDVPILQYARVHAHDRVELNDSFFGEVSDRALWFEQDTLIVCGFRLCPWLRARYSPLQRIRHVVAFVIGWLLDRPVEVAALSPLEPVVSTGPDGRRASSYREAADRAIRWFEQSGVLYDEGRTGVHEGWGTEIYGDGSQRLSRQQRADCIGETAMAYFMHYKVTNDERSLAIANRLHDYVFQYFLCKEDVPWSGMMRFNAEAWSICYQDDVSRAILPQMWQCFVEGSERHLDDCLLALNFLLKTTGSDGMRVSRTNNMIFDRHPEELHRMRSEPAHFPSAHYNAYYYAALLLAYQLTGIRLFLDAGRKGLEALMRVYPDTVREQSQTQELCRLVLPLSWLYWSTQDERHREWLYRVTEDLQRFKHPSGAYLEWDEGYKAPMWEENGMRDNSLVTENGHPVVDLLYSNNWLPMAWMQAYFVTGDSVFLDLWKESSDFMIQAQLTSANPDIDGAWARAYDVELGEVFGSPSDMGWGPWAIESGWTVAEIASGLMVGELKDELAALFREHAAKRRKGTGYPNR